jgi:hypothetical protein
MTVHITVPMRMTIDIAPMHLPMSSGTPFKVMQKPFAPLPRTFSPTLTSTPPHTSTPKSSPMLLKSARPAPMPPLPPPSCDPLLRHALDATTLAMSRSTAPIHCPDSDRGREPSLYAHYVFTHGDRFIYQSLHPHTSLLNASSCAEICIPSPCVCFLFPHAFLYNVLVHISFAQTLLVLDCTIWRDYPLHCFLSDTLFLTENAPYHLIISLPSCILCILPISFVLLTRFMFCVPHMIQPP